MLRLLKRQRREQEEAAPPSPVAADPVPASERKTPSVSSAATSAPATPEAAAVVQSRIPVERRDSDEFFSSAIQELGGDDFLLSPQKVTVADINSIAEASPASSSRQWTRSLHSGAGSSSPPEAQHHHQRTRSGSSGGAGSVTRSLFTASEDDQSWLVAAPSGNGRASAGGDFMLEDSPPRRASGRSAASAFAPSPSRIPSGPTESPSASGGSGRSRIPKPTSDYASPVKASGGGTAGGSRIPASPTPSSSSATRIPSPASPPPAYSEERPAQQQSGSSSRLPRGPTASFQDVQEPPAALEPLRQHGNYSDVLHPAAQATEPDAELAPASPKADTLYGEPYLPQSMLQPQVQPQPRPRPQPPAQYVAPQRQVQTEQAGASAHEHAAADGGEGPGTDVGNRPSAKADDLAAATDRKSQHQIKPQQQTPAQKNKGCCGCCIM